MDKEKKVGHRWRKGVSGNPSGRPTKAAKAAQEVGALVVQCRERLLASATSADQLLEENSVPLVAELIALALHSTNPTLKIRSLLGCVDRILPILKTIENQQPIPTDPKSMTDEQIISLMFEMARVARATKVQRIEPDPEGSGNLQ